MGSYKMTNICPWCFVSEKIKIGKRKTFHTLQNWTCVVTNYKNSWIYNFNQMTNYYKIKMSEWN